MNQAQNTQNTNAVPVTGTSTGTGTGSSPTPEKVQFQMDYFFSGDGPVSDRLTAGAANGGVGASDTVAGLAATLDRLQRLSAGIDELVDVIGGGGGDVGGQNEGQ